MSVDYAHILEGCFRRDRRAQQVLYDTFAPMAMGVCMRYAPDRDAAQDLLQEGFVRVFEHLNQVRDPEKLGSWVYTVVLNECLKQLKKRPSMPFVDDLTVERVELPLDPFGMEEVVLALQRLAPAQRLVFNLMEVEGYTIEETAREMKCSESNVRALLCRAKGRLREILTKEQ